VIEYRSFLNSDPPELVRIWHASQLGRGAADGLTPDALDALIFAQPYFDAQGLIVACDNQQIVGFAHAGFSVNSTQTDLDKSRGVICLVCVHPKSRRKKIGTNLIKRAEKYLEHHGAKEIDAGPADGIDPFYFGLYGGSRPSGFLQSDEAAAPFFKSLGYEVHQKHFVYQRPTHLPGKSISFRMVGIRRKMQLSVSEEPEGYSWWWSTRYGRLDTLRFLMEPKAGGEPVAGLTMVGLDLYVTKWQERCVGITDVYVNEQSRRKGYAQALIHDVCRRLKEQEVTTVEAHAPETNDAANKLLTSAGFIPIDTGIVYRLKAH